MAAGTVLLTFRTNGTDKAAKEALAVGSAVEKSGSRASKGARGLSRFAGGLGGIVDQFLPFNTGLGKMSGGLDGFADKLESGGSRARGWKAAIAGAAAGVVVAAGLMGGALFNVGGVFDDVSDTIRVGTGATGTQLGGLVDVAKDVGNRVPAEFDRIGPAVADLNTRLGLTGDTLTTVTSQVLEASRILGEDIDIQGASAAFSAFGIEGEAVSGSLDTLFRVSQATGVGMNTLASGVARQAVALQELGFGFDQSVSLLGTLDKAGLNSNTVLAGLTKGMVTLAKAGEEPADAFQRVTGEIGGFIEAGDRAKAIELASKIFGTRGAAQFIGALEAGTLNLDALAAAAEGSGDTIMGVSQATADAAESWQIIKNNALTAIEPISTAVYNLVGGAMASLATSAQALSPEIAAGLTGFLGSLSQIGDTIAPLIGPVLQLWQAFSPLSLIFQTLQPILPQVASLLGMLATVVGGALLGVLQTLATVLTPIVDVVLTALSGVLVELMPVVMQVAEVLANALAGALVQVSPLLTMLAEIIGQVLGLVLPLIAPVVSLVSAFFPLIEALLPIVTTLLPPLIDLLMAVLTPVMALLSPILELAGGALGFLANMLSTVITWVVEAITWFFQLVTGSQTAASQFQAAWSGVAGFFQSVFSGIAGFVSESFNNVVGAIRFAINAVIRLVNGAIGGLNSLRVTIPDFVPGIGGTSFGLSIPRIPYLARGGDVEAGMPYVVGDAGYPELFVPETDGKVLPRVPTSTLTGTSADEISASLEDVEISVGSSDDRAPKIIRLVTPDDRVLMEWVLESSDDEEARL